MHVRNLEPDETELHQSIRLEALRQSPKSFGLTYEEAAGFPFSYWEDLTRSVTKPNKQTMVLACEGNAIYGSGYGLLDEQQTKVGRVGGMWIRPECRGKGVGTALVRALINWATNLSFESVELWAPSHEEGALALYRKSGFVETGQCRPFPWDESYEIVEMRTLLT